jgi:Ca2+:H+ antiporter
MDNRNKTYAFVDGAIEVVIRGPFNILLICVPITFMVQGFEAPPIVVFIFALFGIAPLAERLGYITEQLAKHTNDTIGGLLNVTFGNATELIIAIFGLFRGLYRVVQLTLLGSILSNILLVLGSSFLFGGLKRKKQHFGHMFAETNTPLLLISSMSVLFPTVLYGTGSVSDNGLLMVSRCASLVLLALYSVFLYFQV